MREGLMMKNLCGEVRGNDDGDVGAVTGNGYK